MAHKRVGLLLGCGAAICMAGASFASNRVPPIFCNDDAARTYMRPLAARLLFIDPARIFAIATLGGAGGESGAEGSPKGRFYSSYLSCPIRITMRSGGVRYMTLNERFSNAYGEEVHAAPLSFDRNDPRLKWVDTIFPD